MTSQNNIMPLANILLKVFTAVFLIYALAIMYLYNTRAPYTITKTSRIFEDNTNSTKHILQWTDKNTAPFPFMGEGNSAFIKNKCTNTNCFVTDDRSFVNLTDFDAIVFDGRSVLKLKTSDLPPQRSLRQKYVFGATESADRWPICTKIFDNYFNWTWTYKLDSDFRWGYITIYDKRGKKVGPAVDMHWPEKMDPISERLKIRLSRKSKAAAWFVSHCSTISKRETFADEVNKELEKIGWNVDIYGSCGNLKCPRSNRDCDKMVERDYYFYFSFENSFSEDYVTEKLLTALNNYAVPIVFGSANYSRFLPEGSYLDGRKYGPENLAQVMNKIMSNKTMYYDFFRWRNYYTYTQTIGNVDVCNICDALNDEQMVNTVSIKKDFRKWWNGARHNIHCPEDLP